MNNKNSNSSTWIAVVIVVLGILLGAATCSDSGSSRSSTPWGKLGVSESEYNAVYNHYKYGTPIN